VWSDGAGPLLAFRSRCTRFAPIPRHVLKSIPRLLTADPRQAKHYSTVVSKRTVLSPPVLENAKICKTTRLSWSQHRASNSSAIFRQARRRTPDVAYSPASRARRELLPGVKTASDYSSNLYIRGGSPSQNLILLGGTTAYNPTHFFGFFSTFNPGAVKDVQLHKGSGTVGAWGVWSTSVIRMATGVFSSYAQAGGTAFIRPPIPPCEDCSSLHR